MRVVVSTNLTAPFNMPDSLIEKYFKVKGLPIFIYHFSYSKNCYSLLNSDKSYPHKILCETNLGETVKDFLGTHKCLQVNEIKRNDPDLISVIEDVIKNTPNSLGYKIINIPDKIKFNVVSNKIHSFSSCRFVEHIEECHKKYTWTKYNHHGYCITTFSFPHRIWDTNGKLKFCFGGITRESSF